MTTKQGYKQTVLGKIPQEWKVVKLGDIAEIVGGSTPSTTVPEYWNGKIPFVTPTDITKLKYKNYLDNTFRYITEKGVSSISAKLMSPGSVLMTSRATIGFAAINRVHAVTNQGFANLICNKNIDNIYVLYLIRFLKKQIERLANGSTFLEISKTSLRKILISLPSYNEQQKIGSILSNVDEFIQKTSDIISKTQELKRGLMQQLLTRGIGHTKFKQTEIGEIPNEWEVKTVKETLYAKGRIGWRGLKKSEFIEKGPYLITGMHFVKDKIDWDNCFHITIDRYIESPEIQVKINDILLTKDGTIGKVAFIDYLPDKASLNSHLLLLRPLKRDLNPKFLYYVLLSNLFRRFVESIKSGSTLAGLSQSSFNKFQFIFPSYSEQNKIVEILSKVDDKLFKEESKKLHLDQLKNGLMQVLLTGKVRVQVN